MDFNVSLRSADSSGVDNSKSNKTEQKELVIVEWRDIIATSGWEQAPTCPTFFNVGWLVREDKDVIVLATTKDLDDFTGESSDPPPVYYGFHSFPRGAVVSVRPVSS